MSYIITESCIRCKFTDCTNVCPVDCFYEGKNFVAINPDECIDCGVCVPECPLNAIIEFDLNNKNLKLLYNINKKFSKLWININKSKDPYKNNIKWKNIRNKLHLLNI